MVSSRWSIQKFGPDISTPYSTTFGGDRTCVFLMCLGVALSILIIWTYIFDVWLESTTGPAQNIGVSQMSTLLLLSSSLGSLRSSTKQFMYPPTWSHFISIIKSWSSAVVQSYLEWIEKIEAPYSKTDPAYSLTPLSSCAQNTYHTRTPTWSRVRVGWQTSSRSPNPTWTWQTGIMTRLVASI